MTFRFTVATAAAIALLAGVAGCSAEAEPPMTAPPAATASPPPAPVEGDDESEPAVQPGAYVNYFDGAIAATPGTKALFFHASWCPKCRDLEEDILANTIPDGFTVFKVDYDSATELRQRYGVTVQTTIVYVDDDGNALAKGVLYDDTTLAALIAAAP